MSPPYQHELRRRVRLHLSLERNVERDFRASPDDAGTALAATPATTASEQPRNNPYAAWPSAPGFGLYLEIELAVRGAPDPITGYLIDIGAIDALVRDVAVPALRNSLGPRDVAAARSPGSSSDRTAPPPPLSATPASLLRLLLDAGAARLSVPPSACLIQLTPFYSLSMDATRTNQVLLRQFFEFSASHRLHCAEFDDARNRQLFGKCNNPNGHGHNYRLEVAVECAVDDRATPAPGLGAIESIVREQVIDRLDHKHLNSDVPEFATMNPSVENIAVTAHRLLETPIRLAGGTLRSVTVWETEKTCCTYPVPV